MKVLAVDIGGTKIKVLATGQTEPRRALSGRGLTPARMVEIVRDLAKDWEFEAISMGYPGLVGPGGPRSEPGNLGPGWVGFDFAAAFDHPVKIINDAAMQALGSYEGGRMLFLGFGTGLGSAMIAENVIVPLELGRLPYRRRASLGETVSRRGLKFLGKPAWKKVVAEMASTLMAAFEVDYVVLGGGNAKLLREPPPGCRMGHNLTAFRGGFRLWGLDGVPVLGADHLDKAAPPPATEWRLI
jgi:polyphosphate glucokinase